MIHPNTTMQPKLSFLICGLEHSGTTMASDLFREHPLVESGFECGVGLVHTDGQRSYPVESALKPAGGGSLQLCGGQRAVVCLCVRAM